jgi:HEAT repeat protein
MALGLALVAAPAAGVASEEESWYTPEEPPELSKDRTTDQLFWTLSVVEETGDERSAGAEETAIYESATASLDAGRYDQAAALFEEVIALKGRYYDAALYWDAYALYKQGKRASALETLAILIDSRPDSRWRKDAKALDLDIRQKSGQKIVPETTDDEELKLIILDNMIHVDEAKALPMLEKLLASDNSPRIRERALYVLAQSGSPEAQRMIERYARGESDPDMQMKAVEYLGVFGGREAGQLLQELYNSAIDVRVRSKILEGYMISDDEKRLLEAARHESDPALRGKAVEMLGVISADSALWQLYQAETEARVRAKIIESFMISGNEDRILQLAKTEKDADLRRKAVEQLGVMGGNVQLWQLYQSETDETTRAKIIEALWLSDDFEHLATVAKTEENPGLRRKAIEQIGLMGGPESQRLLEDMYFSETEVRIKGQILDAFFIQDNTDALIRVAREEKDKSLRRSAIEKLSLMDSEEVTEFLLQLLDE